MRLALPHLIVGLFSAALIFLVFRDYAIDSAAFIWLISNLVLLTCTVVFYSIYYFRGDTLSSALWGKITFIVSLLWGACWSLPPFIFLGTENILHIGIMVAFIVSMSSVPAPVLVHYPSAYFIFITLPLSAFTIKISIISIGSQQVVQALPPFLWLSLLVYGWDLHKTIIDSIRLRLEKANALEKARQANIEKSRFIAAASHDIRQPLQAAVLSLDAIKANKGQKLDSLLPNLEKSVDSISELITGLLDISKLDSGTVDVQPEHIELTGLLSKLRDRNALAAQGKNLTITHIIDDKHSNKPVVLCDPILLERVLNNLLNNAVRYTDKGGVRIETHHEHTHVIIRITDTGIGISHDQINLIFKEFYQANTVERDHKIGLGLGLSIVKRLCDLQSWQLNVTSKSGEGSCFTISVPAGSRSDIKPVQNSLGYSLAGIMALIIDDNTTARDALAEMLSAWQCNVLQADNAYSAINALKEHSSGLPDIIISDYRLADQENGIEAIKAIQVYTGKEIPAILMTGDIAPEELNHMAESGVFVMHKPIKPGHLRAFINRRCCHTA